MALAYRARHETVAVVRLTDGAIIGPESAADWAEYQAWVAEGNAPEPAEQNERLVPRSVSPLQMRRALTQTGLRDGVEAAVTQMDQDIRDAWEYAVEIQRDHPAILQLAAQMNKTPEEIDDLFVLAHSF